VTEALFTLPPGHPEAGYVTPDLSGRLNYGVLPDVEEEQADVRDDEHDAEVEAVAEHENDVASEIHDDRRDTSGVRLTALIPPMVSIKAPEMVLLHVMGSGFTESSEIWWHDHFEPTVFVSETELTTWVVPWVFLMPDLVEVRVGESEPPPEARADDGEEPQVLLFQLLP
jgi:hypothetical protein